MYTQKIDEIEFEGTIVRPRAGVYRCPYCKGDERYPVPSWKTLKGFQNHMAGCYGKPSAVESKRIKDAEKAEKKLADDAAKVVKDAEAKESSPVKIGDSIHVCHYYVSKPTHEQRGSRMVKVRYEEERQYYGRTLEVTDIRAGGENNPVLITSNGAFHLSLAFPTIEAAKQEASERQRRYDQGRHEASMYR